MKWCVVLLVILCAYARSQSNDKTIAAFVKWANASGVIGMDAILVQRSPGAGHGLFARREFRQGELVFALPMQLALAAEDGPEDELDRNGHAQLALLAERARGQSSTWAAYIRSLPQEQSPVFAMQE